MIFTATVHLSNDFRRTSGIAYGFGPPPRETFEEAALAGVYDGEGFTFMFEADSHAEACEIVYAVCNSSPGELHCDALYEPIVEEYRRLRNRSLSMGDMVVVTCKQPGPQAEDGRYICDSVGFARL